MIDLDISPFRLAVAAALMLAWTGIVWMLSRWTERDRMRRAHESMLQRLVAEARQERLVYRDGAPRLVRHDGVCTAPGGWS